MMRTPISLTVIGLSLLLFAGDVRPVRADGGAASPLVDRLVVGTDKKGKVHVLEPVTGELLGKLKGAKFKKTPVSVTCGCYGSGAGDFIAVTTVLPPTSPPVVLKKPKKPKKTRVYFFDADTLKRNKKKPHKKFYPFGKDWRGGANLATADVDGDGVDELITGVGSGGIFQVNVFDSITLEQIAFFEAFPRATDSSQGVFVDSGDLDGDGTDEIITSLGRGGVPQIRTWDFVPGPVDIGEFPVRGVFAPGASFDGYGVSYTGGVRVAVGDVTGNGCDDIVIAPAGPGENRIRGFDGTGVLAINDIVLGNPFLGVGAGVTTGDVTNDGRAEILWWVFYAAATTDVEYTITVTDTQTGFVKEYQNALGVASPAITDTDAFATCAADVPVE